MIDEGGGTRDSWLSPRSLPPCSPLQLQLQLAPHHAAAAAAVVQHATQIDATGEEVTGGDDAGRCRSRQGEIIDRKLASWQKLEGRELHASQTLAASPSSADLIDTRDSQVVVLSTFYRTLGIWID